MPEPVRTVDLGPAARRLADLVAAVPDEELARATPCPAYALGDLIEHVGALAIAFAAAASKELDARTGQAAPGDGARLGADWRARMKADCAAFSTRLAERATWARETAAKYTAGAQTRGSRVS